MSLDIILTGLILIVAFYVFFLIGKSGAKGKAQRCQKRRKSEFLDSHIANCFTPCQAAQTQCQLHYCWTAEYLVPTVVLSIRTDKEG